MSARIDTAETLTKAEKLARAMDNVRSGGRAFDRQLAAQVSIELRAQRQEIDRLIAALAEAEDRGAAQMRERAAEEAISSAHGGHYVACAIRALPIVSK